MGGWHGWAAAAIEAVHKYPDLLRKYLGSVVPVQDNYYSARAAARRPAGVVGVVGAAGPPTSGYSTTHPAEPVCDGSDIDGWQQTAIQVRPCDHRCKPPPHVSAVSPFVSSCADQLWLHPSFDALPLHPGP